MNAHVLFKSLIESVEALRDSLGACLRVPSTASQWNCTRVHLDAGNNAHTRERIDKARSSRVALPQRLFEENHAAHVVLHAIRSEDPLAHASPILLGVLDADVMETFPSRADRLVSREHALAVASERARDILDG